MKAALLGVILFIFIIFYMLMVVMFALAFKVLPHLLLIDVGVKVIVGLGLVFIISFICLIIEELIHEG